MNPLIVLFIVACALLPEFASARTLIVAADGSAEYTMIGAAAEAAIAGDSILVRDGQYENERFIVDSAVVVLAEHPGQAWIYVLPDGNPIRLRAFSVLSGFGIVGSVLAIWHDMVTIDGRGVEVRNCEFVPDGRMGHQIVIANTDDPPSIHHCRFHLAMPIWTVQWPGNSDYWMPDNYWGSLDTVLIHNHIDDGCHGDTTGGCVYVNPIWDHFEWLGIEDEPRVLGSAHTISIFPNPSPGFLRFNVGDELRSPEIRIYNLLGQLVWSKTGPTTGFRHSNRSTVDLSLMLPTGNYFFVLSTADKVYRQKFTIIH